MDAESLIRRTVRWAWERDETGEPSTRQTVRYTLTLYTVTLGLIVLLGVSLSVFGYRTAAFALLIFGIWFTVFMGSVNVGWEWLKYRSFIKQQETPPEDSGPERELAPGLTIEADTKIGFLVTVVGLMTLMVSYEAALFIISNL